MNIRKRNGEVQIFDINRVVNAVFAALQEVHESNRDIAIDIAQEAESLFQEHGLETVEDMQDLLEGLLMEQYPKAAKAFILYRQARQNERNKKMPHYNYLTSKFLKPYFKNPNPFSTSMGEFVYYRTYARAIPEENRRETWAETIARVVEFSTQLEVQALQNAGKEITPAYKKELQTKAEALYDAMYNMRLFPSGRSLFVGGSKASYTSALSNFNCSHIVMDNLAKFAELSLVSMLGVGVGVNLQQQYIAQLPKVNTKIEIIHQDYRVKQPHERKDFTSLEDRGHGIIDIIVGDSRFGWAKAIEMYLDIISSKQYEDINFIVFNYDNIRPLGERLKTFGGFASGHGALQNIFTNIDNVIHGTIHENKWKKLNSLDCLDIATSIAEGVVAGGTRRSSLICFADPEDRGVLEAKQNLYMQDTSGNWVMDKTISHRTMSNNTIVYEDKPSLEALQKHFELIRYSGEPGLLNKAEMLRRNPNAKGTNPCGEILLDDRQTCNLTEINLSAFVNEDGTYDKQALLEAQKLSATIGYRMASVELELHEWNVAAKKDMLLGCSLSGIVDFINKTQITDNEFKLLLQELRQVAHETAKEYAIKFNMQPSATVTTLKPSGSVSLLPSISAGIHFPHAEYFIRRIRISSADPLCKAMTEMGFTSVPENGQTEENHTTRIFSFPMKSPAGDNKFTVSALRQLELYKMLMENYVDANASNTVTVRKEEWEDTVKWVYDNWDSIVGMTFLELNDEFYQLAPYEKITQEEYNELNALTPQFNASIANKSEDFSDLLEIAIDECTMGTCPVR